ncbi:MAG: cytidine deaminase [Bryobacteraceae bacterium]|nr:cytidine deaminase [Bryobacteraceae bacterium]
MQHLIDAAIAARFKAFAPYSKFLVGAALETRGGHVYTGCNVENATYGLTVCAERVAILKAISEGEPLRSFPRMVIVADTEDLTPPCGACRQILWEFCGDMDLILVNLHGKTESYRVSELFPRAFDVSFLP